MIAYVNVRICCERNRKLQAKDVGIYDKSLGNVLLTTYTAGLRVQAGLRLTPACY